MSQIDHVCCFLIDFLFFGVTTTTKAFDLYKHFDRILIKKDFKSIECMPCELKCLHYCSGPGSSVLSIVMPIVKRMMTPHMRLRTVVQSGSDMEILEKLHEYGLQDVHARPLLRGAIYNQEQCAEFLRQQRIKEQQQQQEATTLTRDWLA